MIKTTNSLSLYDFISLSLRLYGVVGVKLFHWNVNDYTTLKEKCLSVTLLLIIGVNLVTIISFGLFGEFVDIVQMSQWLLYFIFAVNAFCKMLSVFLGRKMLYNVLKEIDKLFPETPEQRRAFHLMDSYTYIMRHAKIISIQHFAIAGLFILFPIVQSSIEYLASDDEEKVFIARTPYIMLYPFDSSRGLGYLYAYSTQLIGGLTTSFYYVGSDLLLLCTIYLVIMQYRYLCCRIEKFKSQGYEEDMKELYVILERHSLLNELAQTVNGVFSFSILLNYIISIFIIVMISIQIVTGSETLDFVKFVGFFTAATTQVYYVCMFGSLIIENSAKVSESLIGQEWYNTDVRYQRMLILAIARSQKPSHLTAFKFFIISTESFGNLMTTAYQFFTLLKAQMDEENI